jgi:hypothetical protein
MVIKKALRYFLVITFIGCNSPDVIEKNSSTILSTKNVGEDINRTFIERYVQTYVDSTENLKAESEIPHFLFDAQFDYSNVGAWPSAHTPLSVRAQIINRVNNCNSLKIIYQSKRRELFNTPVLKDGLKVPLAEYSFHDLIKRRLADLNCL